MYIRDNQLEGISKRNVMEGIHRTQHGPPGSAEEVLRTLNVVLGVRPL
jgi:hypothetical protein